VLVLKVTKLKKYMPTAKAMAAAEAALAAAAAVL